MGIRLPEPVRDSGDRTPPPRQDKRAVLTRDQVVKLKCQLDAAHNLLYAAIAYNAPSGTDKPLGQILQVASLVLGGVKKEIAEELEKL